MALTVEDGTGLAAAESYASAAEAIAYLDAHAASGSSNVFTAASTPDQEIALRAATDYLDGNYSSRWLGYRANQVQALDWPRSDVTDIDGYAIASTTVPQRLKDATAELALRFIATSSGHDTQRLQPDQTPPVGQVTVKRTKAG
ncbi:MAG: DnaT-like ssDNA-binding protein, partial [Mycobacterium sp.]